MRLRLDNPFVLAAAGFAATAATLAAVRADAQVMQVADDGSMEMRSGVGAVTWDDGEVGATAPVPAAIEPRAGRSAPAAYAATLARVAAAHGISPALLEAVIWQESRWRADAVSPVGARGLTQLMPATARALGVDPGDPAAAMEGGARYLRAMLDRFGGDVERALAAYNAGPARVARAGGVPAIAETRAYVAAILDRLSDTKEK